MLLDARLLAMTQSSMSPVSLARASCGLASAAWWWSKLHSSRPWWIPARFSEDVPMSECSGRAMSHETDGSLGRPLVSGPSRLHDPAVERPAVEVEDRAQGLEVRGVEAAIERPVDVGEQADGSQRPRVATRGRDGQVQPRE